MLLIPGLGRAGSDPASPVIPTATGNLLGGGMGGGGQIWTIQTKSMGPARKMVQYILELCQQMRCRRVSLSLPELRKSLLPGDGASPGCALMFSSSVT